MRFREFRQDRPIKEVFIKTFTYVKAGYVLEVVIWRKGSRFEAVLKCQAGAVQPASIGLGFGEIDFSGYCPNHRVEHSCTLRTSPELIEEMERLPENELLVVRDWID